MKINLLIDKSIDFAVRILKLHQLYMFEYIDDEMSNSLLDDCLKIKIPPIFIGGILVVYRLIIIFHRNL